MTVSAHPDEDYRTTDWRPAALSLLVHVILVVFLILFGNSFSRSLPGEPERRGSIVLAVAPDSQPQKYLTQQDTLSEPNSLDQPQNDPLVEPLTDTPPPTIELPQTATANPDLAGPPPIDSMLTDATSMTKVPDKTSASQAFELSAEDLKQIEDEQRLLRSRQPKGNPARVSLFGSGDLEGRSFVFLIDRSKSMGSDGLGVLKASRNELVQAIDRLEPHHTFQIVGYHSRTVTLSTRNMLPATDANKALVPGFIENLAAFGSTNHEYGLTVALAFEPDVVVLMTDGGYPELNDDRIRMLGRLSRRRTTIHCLQFGLGPLQIPVNFMTKIAERNDGTYRYVDVSQW